MKRTRYDLSHLPKVQQGALMLLMGDVPENDDEMGEVFNSHLPPSAIVMIDEVDSNPIRKMYQCLHVFEVLLNDGSAHECIYRSETEAHCLTHVGGFCIAPSRVILHVAGLQRTH